MSLDAELAGWLEKNGFGGDVNGRGANRITPLMQAALRGDADIAQKLIAAGADVAATNADGNNAIWLACVEQRLDLIDILAQAGVALDHQNDGGASALMFCASSGRFAAVRHLVARGAKIALETPDGFSAIDMANTLEILNFLRATRKAQRATT